MDMGNCLATRPSLPASDQCPGHLLSMGECHLRLPPDLGHRHRGLRSFPPRSPYRPQEARAKGTKARWWPQSRCRRPGRDRITFHHPYSLFLLVLSLRAFQSKRPYDTV